jgi:hypothetical protein
VAQGVLEGAGIMLSRVTFVAFALTTPVLTACTDQIEDELEVDDAAEGDASKADAVGSTYTYYFVKPDLRRCAAPFCGGVYYRLANAETTRCLDGKKAEWCYAASENDSRLGLGDIGMTKVAEAKSKSSFGQGTHLLVRAVIGSKDWGNGLPRFAELRPSEAWIAQGANDAAGPLATIEDTGVRCIAAPCPFWRERKLNSTVRAEIAELGWDKSGANDAQISAALDQIHGTGLIISGYRYSVSGPAGQGKARSVTQFWLRATDEPAAKQCFVGGCSGQICSDEEGVASTCEWREEYACYQSATCEVQADGNCGWTQTSELQACLGTN